MSVTGWGSSDLEMYLQRVELATREAQLAPVDRRDFWKDVALGLLDGLANSATSGDMQAQRFRERVSFLLEMQAGGRLVYPNGEQVPEEDRQNFIRDLIWDGFLALESE